MVDSKYTLKQLQKMSSKQLLQITKEIGGEYYKTLPYFKTEEEGLKALDSLLKQNRSNASLIKDITSMQTKLKTTTKVINKTDNLVNNISKQKSNLINNYANYTAKEVAKNYAESQKTLKNIINRHLEKTEWSIVEMKKFERDVQLFGEINVQLERLGQSTEKLLTKNLQIVVKDTVLNDAYFMEQFVSKSSNISILNSNKINEIIKFPWSGLPYSDTIWKDVDNMKYVLKNQLTQSMLLGENPKKLAKRVNDILGKGAYNATRLARTEVISVGARTQTEFAKDNADIIEGLKWVACIDSRTSKECIEHNGEVKTKEEWDSIGKQIPCHPNCRCSYVMEVKDKYKIDKKIEDFDDWIKNKRQKGEIVDGQGYMKPKKPIPKPTPKSTPKKLVVAPKTPPKIPAKKIGSEYTKAFENKVNGFKKVKEVQEYMQKEFPSMNINLGRMDIESARKVSTAMAEMKDKFPFITDEYIHGFGSFTHYKNLGGNPPSSKTCNAFYSPITWKQGNGIYFNSKSWDEVIRRHKISVKSMWHVPVEEAGKSTIYHEFGHTIVDCMKYEDKTSYIKLIDEWEAFNLKPMSEKKALLSQYGSSSFQEFCAEAFCEFIGSENPRPIAQKIGSIIYRSATEN